MHVHTSQEISTGARVVETITSRRKLSRDWTLPTISDEGKFTVLRKQILTVVHWHDSSIISVKEIRDYVSVQPECEFIQFVQLEFTRFVQQWRAERGITSSVSEMLASPSYQKIIAMGAEVVVPLILSHLKQNLNDPDHWFIALKTLTDENPIPEDAYGDTKKMADAWLSWQKINNVW